MFFSWSCMHFYSATTLKQKENDQTIRCKNSLRDNFISIREQKIVTLYILAKAHKLFVNSMQDHHRSKSRASYINIKPKLPKQRCRRIAKTKLLHIKAMTICFWYSFYTNGRQKLEIKELGLQTYRKFLSLIDHFIANDRCPYPNISRRSFFIYFVFIFFIHS